jgi:hypothetical protein
MAQKMLTRRALFRFLGSPHNETSFVGGIITNFLCVYLLLNVRYNCFRFGGRHLGFPVSADVGDESVESHNPENLGIVVGTTCVSVVSFEM